MKINLTDAQKEALELMHDTTRDGRARDRIKAVLLASEGWTAQMIAQALRIHESTVSRHLKDYFSEEKLAPENGGSESRLSAEQTTELVEYLMANLMHTTAQIVAYVRARWQVTFTVAGMTKWLHRQGFSYKKPMGAPHKFDADKQQQFIETYPLSQKIHIILDGAGYHRSGVVQFFAEVLNIELHYLPPYSPNLNPIERLWKYVNEQVRNNVYFPDTKTFRETLRHFFHVTLPEKAKELTTRLTDNFQILKPASSS
ncbi:transposase [Xenorhabdus bovienii]|uniref:transposase n=1 Tax=Xenorhabdus bovienii TaxID=40576 RepID=UPI0023B304CF|nr:transposase [Xenorhabdus bovienii]MDE9446849.1 transposase [Xenorhabdus bovienii]